MDNERFGAFIAQLRKEQGLTQRELADRLNVTDKAVSKWETAKGFPDVKLLEPLAQALGVSLVELMQGKRQEADTLTVAEAGRWSPRPWDSWSGPPPGGIYGCSDGFSPAAARLAFCGCSPPFSARCGRSW